jgi:uncharacterized protein with HEPN domain
MSERDWLFRLADIIDRCNRILRYTAHVTRQQLNDQPMVVDAVLRNLEIVGEAAARVPPEVRTAHPNLPWQSMIGMRNRLIHDYPGIDLDIVWQTIQEDIPDLLSKAEAALNTELAKRQGDPG